MLCRGPCLPWLRSWLTGTALLDGRGNGQAKQEQSSAAFLHVSQFQSQPFSASNPWVSVALIDCFLCIPSDGC